MLQAGGHLGFVVPGNDEIPGKGDNHPVAAVQEAAGV